MSLPTRHMLIGMFLGAACATAIAMTGHGIVIETFADEVEAPAFDVSKLVKFNDRQYAVEAEDWVSSEPLSTVRVKKVEAGVVSYVTITTTETGTYSTDAMFSKHVQYPGITVTQKPEWSPAASRSGAMASGPRSPAAGAARSSTIAVRTIASARATGSPACAAPATASVPDLAPQPNSQPLLNL